ncbi:hypothetical protein EON64_08660 [archaeon]|nr:MAG: hypothetical protein EON64_08660 [archaeon]
MTHLALSVAKDREQDRSIHSVASRVLASSALLEGAVRRGVKPRPSFEGGWSVFEFFSGIG